MERKIAFSVALVLGLFGGGCSSQTGAREQMSMTMSCGHTRCDKKKDEVAGYCGTCLSACASASYDCDGSSACKSSCGEHTVVCTDAEKNECLENSFTALLPENLSGELDAACNRERTHDAACGVMVESDVGAACHHFATVERGELATAYDCLANLPCKADGAACSPKPTTFGEEICGSDNQNDNRCPDLCDKPTKTLLNIEGGWLRSDVQQVAKDCLGHDACADVSACLRAWQSATIN